MFKEIHANFALQIQISNITKQLLIFQLYEPLHFIFLKS